LIVINSSAAGKPGTLQDFAIELFVFHWFL